MNRRKQPSSYARRERGYVLVAFSLALLLILGSVGLCFDIGSMYVGRSEAQSFCDAAAIAATLRLDGTAQGIANATADALATAKTFHFGTKQFAAANADISVTFGKTVTDTFVAAPPNPEEYVCARVTLRGATFPMLFLPVVTSRFSASISASATAKQVPVTDPGSYGFAPFSPFAHPTTNPPSALPSYPDDPYNLKAAVDQADKHGGLYSFHWPNTEQLNISQPTKVCPDDADYSILALKASAGNDTRGYIWNQSSDITDSIVADVIPPEYTPFSVGDPVPFTEAHGNMLTNITNALELRVLQDSDSTTVWWKDYVEGKRGNGRRLLLVPINVGQCGTVSYTDHGHTYTYTNLCELNGKTYSSYEAVGFSLFFLRPANEYSSAHGNENACAEYVGPAVLGSSTPSLNNGLFAVKLVQ